MVYSPISAARATAPRTSRLRLSGVRRARCSKGFLHENAERVRAVGAEGADLDEARRAIEAERLGLQTAHLEAQHACAAAYRDGFDFIEKPAAELQPARGRRDEHALDLRPALAGIDHGTATQRLPVDSRDQKCHLRLPERGHVEHVIALRRVERGHVGITRLQQQRDLGLIRVLDGDLDCARSHRGAPGPGASCILGVASPAGCESAPKIQMTPETRMASGTSFTPCWSEEWVEISPMSNGEGTSPNR